MRPAGIAVASIMIIGAFAGCLGQLGEAADPKDVIAPSTPISLPGFFHDLSEILPDVSLQAAIEHHYRIPMSDGLNLDAWVLVPNGVDEPVPLVIEITPYYGGGSIKECKVVPGVTDSVACLVNQINNLLKRGYATGIVSVRGTGSSEGCFTQGGPQEAQDSAAAIEFLAKQSWSNGRVGVIGLSYVGTTANDVWVEAPPSLKTVVSMAGITELYKYNFVNGVHIEPQGYSFNFYYWPVTGLAPAGIEGGTNTDPTQIPASYYGELCPDQLDVQQGGLHGALSADYAGYWQVRNFSAEYLRDPAKPRASMLYHMGLQDWNVKPHNIEPFYSHLKASGVPLFTLMSNQTHLWPLREDWSHEILVAWLDQFLKEKDTGILDAPPVWLHDDDGVWRMEDTWPPRDAQQHRLYLASEGSLSWNEPATEARHTFTETRDQVPAPIILRSEPLQEALHLTHMPRMHLAAESDGAHGVVVASVAEELPDGTIRPFNWAIQSLNHLNTPEKGHADISGRRIEGWVDLFPQEDVVHKGSRLVVYLSNQVISNGQPAPGMEPFATGSTITVFGKSTWIDFLSDPTIVAEAPQPKMLPLPKA